MKRLKIMCAAVVLLLLLTSLMFAKGEQESDGEAGSGEEKITIIEPIMGLNNPYVSAMAGYAKDWAKELGYEFIVLDGELDSIKNAQNMEEAIAMNPDIIILMTVDSAATSNGVKKAWDAGIPVIMEHMLALPEDEQYTVAYTGPSSYIQGRLVAEMMYERVGDGAKIVEIQTVAGQETTYSRHNGFVDRVEEEGWDMEIIAHDNGDAQMDKSMAIMEDFLTRFGEDGIDGVYCLDDTMAIAAITVLKENNIDPATMPVIGVGGSRQGLASIKAGEMYGTIAQSPKISQVSTKKLVQKILAEDIKPPQRLDPYHNYMDHPKVTIDNVDEYMPGDW